MLAIKTGGIVSPLDIAEGRADAFLLELNRVVAAFGARVYVRPMPEMNGAWNEYCAFNRDGSSRGPRYSTAAFRRAFARIALLARGGAPASSTLPCGSSANQVSQRIFPVTQARMVWNPQGTGIQTSPRTPRTRTTRETRTSMSSRTTSTTSGSMRRGMRTRRSTHPIRTSRTRSPSGASGESTTRRTSSAWPLSCGAIPGWSSSRTSAASRARSGTSRPSHEAAPPTDA